MIDEKKLISHIENQYRQWGEEYTAEQILGDIEDFPKVGEWIPVKDRLPDKPGSYRVTCLYADKWYRVKDDLFYSDKTWGYDNIHRERKVIAWKEIEEPYKGETE